MRVHTSARCARTRPTPAARQRQRHGDRQPRHDPHQPARVSGASRIRVLFADGLESDAKFVSQHPENDLAVLKARNPCPTISRRRRCGPKADLQARRRRGRGRLSRSASVPRSRAGVVSGPQAPVPHHRRSISPEQPDPVRRRGESRQLGRAAAQCRGRGGRHRHRDAGPGGGGFAGIGFAVPIETAPGARQARRRSR